MSLIKFLFELSDNYLRKLTVFFSAYSHSEVLYTQPPPSKRFPGDWICVGCQGLNYSRRTDCYRCHAEKPESEMTKYKDDWMCPKCNGNNFSRRVDCYKCKTPKPDPTVSVSA